jgi:S1-C subfamily serine protease
VDDERLYKRFIEQLMAYAEKDACLPANKLQAQLQRSGPVVCPALSPASEILTPQEVYRRALPAVFVLGSIYRDDDGEWTEGMYATAWVVAAEGILATNWHVFSDLHDSEVFGVVDHQGRVYPVVEILGGNKTADVAFFRVAARQLTPLPLSSDYAAVGSWVGVLGHPGDNFYVFTTGTVTRYSTNRNDDGQQERWMGLTADYAGGSSGSPVLDARGAVVGMAALTLTLDDGAPPPAPARRRALSSRPLRLSLLSSRASRSLLSRWGDDNKSMPPGKPLVDRPPPVVQMVLKMAVPAPDIARHMRRP